MSLGAGVHEEMVEIGRHRLRVRRSGDGPPVLMLMGIGGNLDMWRPLQDALPDRQLITFDVPGTGGSSSPCTPLTMRSFARLAVSLLDHLRCGHVDVLGISWGGALAQQIAIAHPGTVRRLVLAAAGLGWSSVPGRPSALRFLLSPRRFHSVDYLTRAGPAAYGGRTAREPELLRAHSASRLQQPPTVCGYFAQLFSMATFTSAPYLTRIKAPTLILAGDDDPVVPLINGSILVRGIPNARLHVVHGGGHLFLLDSPEQVAPIITSFLDEDG